MKIWTPADDARLRELYPTHTTPEIARLMGRSVPSISNRRNKLGLSKDTNSGRFQPGQVAPNKGKHYQAGGRSVETQFKPGHKPHTWHPIGHKRVTKEGYLQRKVRDTGVTRRDYVAVHHLIWIEAGNEIPAGHALVFRNGDKTDIRLDNLELISRADLMRRNCIYNYPRELVTVIKLRARIVRKINRRTKDVEKHD